MRQMLLFRVVLQVTPILAGVICCKLIVHKFGLEVIPLNALFVSLIGAHLILIGFLLGGAMSGFKENKMLPGSIAGNIVSIADEVHFAACKAASYEAVKDRLIYVHSLAVGIRHWFKKELKTKDILENIDGLSREYALLEKHTQPTYITRLKQDQADLRDKVTRIHAIRENKTIRPGYILAMTTTALTIIGMIFLKTESFNESLFFTALVTCLQLSFLKFFRDLDNPFGHYDRRLFEDVPLNPIDEAVDTLRGRLNAYVIQKN